MPTHTQQIVNKAWSFAHLLRDDGLSYMAYTEQITFLLFLKMAHQRTQPPWNRPPIVPSGLDWPSLLTRDGEELETHYRHILTELPRQGGMFGEIFQKALQKIQNPATLKRLIVDLIDPEDWMSTHADVKGDIYEGLLAKSAQESPKGADQYFTPRELIKAIVDYVRPEPDDTMCDPARGTGGFLLAAHDYVVREHGGTLDPEPSQVPPLRVTFRQRLAVPLVVIVNMNEIRRHLKTLRPSFRRYKRGPDFIRNGDVHAIPQDECTAWHSPSSGLYIDHLRHEHIIV